jgi:hypothetical protein
MRMVVDDDEGAALAVCADYTPLGPSSVDGSIRMSFLNGPRHVTCIQAALAESVGRMLRPGEADDLLCRRASRRIR